MNDTTENDAAREAFIRWVREQHDQMARYAVQLQLIGEDAEGRPVWSIPHQVFLGRFYDKAAPTSGYWYIGGGLPSDHIDVSAAASPRDAVRHFSLKWQMQAAQIEQATPENQDNPADFANVAESLVKSAEALIQCADNDELWRNMPDAEPT